MEQGKYKILFLKLSAAALGLVVMLSLAITLGQNSLSVNAPLKAEWDQEDLKSELALNEEFNIVVESSPSVLKDAGLRDLRLKAEHVKKLILIKSDILVKISGVIKDIAAQPAIPADIKENIIINLERQLAKNEQNLYDLERRLLGFSSEMTLSQSKYKNRAKCSKEIIIETCDGSCPEDDRDTGRDVRDKGKASREDLSWI